MFKKCPMCAEVWNNRKQFLEDRKLCLNGYQADFEKIDKGLFFFTHKVEGCYSTMAIFAEEFFDLHAGEKYTIRKTGSAECPGYCLEKDVLEPCPAECECAFVRDVIQIIKDYRKGELEEPLLN